MSISFVPVEQIIPALVTAELIKKGTTDPVVINKRAQTALSAAAIITDISSGNATQAQADFNALLTNPNMDPVVAFELQKLLALGFQQLSIATAIGDVQPLVGETEAAVATNIAAGVAFAANTEIAANPLPVAPVAPPAPSVAVTATASK